jgi:hypothetical protein
VNTGEIYSAGIFGGATDEVITISGSFTVQLSVLNGFGVSLFAHSSSRAQARGQAGLFPIADGSGGFGVTLGVQSITAGAYLEWRGQEWSGECGDSAQYVPDNPVPAPSVISLACLAAGAAIRRRRS